MEQRGWKGERSLSGRAMDGCSVRAEGEAMLPCRTPISRLARWSTLSVMHPSIHRTYTNRGQKHRGGCIDEWMPTFEVMCSKCREMRWPTVPLRPQHYVCARCHLGKPLERPGSHPLSDPRSDPPARHGRGSHRSEE